jgi:hypothetical protein
VLGPSSRTEIAVSRVRTSLPDAGGSLFDFGFDLAPVLRFAGARLLEAFFLPAFFFVVLAAFFFAVLRDARFLEAFFTVFFLAFFFTLFFAFFFADFLVAFLAVFRVAFFAAFFAVFRLFLRAAIDQFSQRLA